MADLDGNGLLSRDEFSWFNIRTSDENVADDEWQVVEGESPPSLIITIYLHPSICFYPFDGVVFIFIFFSMRLMID